MIRYFYVFVPLVVLIVLTSLACLIGYGIVQLFDALPLQKAISKATLVLLVLLIVPAHRYLHLTKEDLGFANRRVFVKQLGGGLALGLVTLMPVFYIQYSLGINIIDETKNWTAIGLIGKISVAFLLAFLISFLEEPLFRGLLLAGLSKKFSHAAAIACSSVYYSALHFLSSNTKIVGHDVVLGDAFKLAFEAYNNLLNPAIYPAFYPLFMVGVFLGCIRTRFKSGLGVCIGCHAAWVWQIKMNKEWFNTDFNSPYLWLVSSYDGVVGPLVTAWLSACLIAYWLYQKYLASAYIA